MSAMGRISLSQPAHQCLFSKSRVTVDRRLQWIVGNAVARSIASVRQRRRANRMVLSTRVASPSLRKPKENRFGPFAGMNQTEARIQGTPPPRSQAARKRSREPEKAEPKEGPLYKALKMQTTLSPISYAHRNATKERITSIDSFDQFPLLPAVRSSIFTHALPDMVDISPTPIQRLAIPWLLKGLQPQKKSSDTNVTEVQYEQYLLAAETGSGKTLAYLIPLLDALKREEVAEKEEEARRQEQKAKDEEEKQKARIFDIEPEEPPLTNAGRPRIIIIAPTAELVEQIGARVKYLSHALKYRSGMVSSAHTPRRIKNTVFRADGIDILVSTPYLLTSIAQKDPYIFSRVKHLVLDEADSLLDRSFSPITKEIISKVAPSLRRLILCSATIPRSLDNFLRAEYPKIKRLTTPSLHSIPRRVQMGVVDIDKNLYRGNRNLACADVIWAIGKAGDPSESAGELERYLEPRVKKILVFVNDGGEAAEVAGFLQSKGIDAVSLPNLSRAGQFEALAEFTEPRRLPTAEEIMELRRKRAENKAIPFEMPNESSRQGGPERILPNTKVLVTTDRTSRGIDTIAVKTVILYDVPNNTIDFIHRLGRLGRMGKRGRGIVLVGKNDRKDVVREVREAMFRGQALI